MKVIFHIEGGSPVQTEGNPGGNLLELARQSGIALDAPCSGSGTCGKCRVRLMAGELESTPSRHLTKEEYENGWRLACCSRLLGDCEVFVPAAAGAFRSHIRTADLENPRERAIFEDCQARLRQKGIGFSNSFRAVELALEAPTLEDTLPDGERLSLGIREALGISRVTLSYSVMKKLARTLRENDFRVCAKGRLEEDAFLCMDICPPEDKILAGCAIDIGTTTVSMVLTCLKTGKLLARASAGNGQIRYGADVINRIVRQGRPGGREELQRAILDETLNPMLAQLCRDAGVRRDSVLRLTVSANTTMNHLLLGVDAAPVRMEPYVPSFFAWEGLTAGDLKLEANPGARVVIAPNIGSYVGGDITAGTLAVGLWDEDEMGLFIDLGTNGEIVFGNREFLISCACSAGPAFEGGDISCGMRATDGAVEAAVIHAETLEPELTVIGGGKAAGICGSGLIDLVAELFRKEIINAKGLFRKEGRRILRDAFGTGRYVLSFPEESATGREVALTEVDIDNFIRAKGAVYSAIDTLLQSVDMDAQVIDRILVAGGIGSGINMKNAVAIGMFPALPPESFFYVGNTSLAGAYAMTVSEAAAEKCDRVASSMTYLELSTCPGYMDAFVAACFLPHTDTRRFPAAGWEG